MSVEVSIFTHKAKNIVVLHREDLKNKHYLAVHLYPDDTVEITGSENWPRPTEKGLAWHEQIRADNNIKQDNTNYK